MNAVSRLVPHPGLSVVLALVWLMIHGRVTGGTVLVGVVLAVSIPLLAAPVFPRGHRRLRWQPLLRVLRAFLVDLVIANLRVVWIVLAPKLRAEPRFIAVPVELTSPFAASILASIVTMTPGTVSVELDLDAGNLWIHGLDVDDPDALTAHIKARYEQPLKELFA